MDDKRFSAFSLIAVLFVSQVFASSPDEDALASIAIAQAVVDIGNQRTQLPDRPPQAIGPDVPPVSQGDKAGADGRDAIGTPVDPMLASVVVEASSEVDDLAHVGSGTVIQSDSTGSTVLSCSHIQRDLKNPVISIQYGGKSYAALPLSFNHKLDLATYRVAVQLPSIKFAKSIPADGSVVYSIGSFAKSPTMRINGIDAYDVPACIMTDWQEVPGRSGGGLFYGNELIGVIKAFVNQQPAKSLYVSLDVIHEFLLTPPIKTPQLIDPKEPEFIDQAPTPIEVDPAVPQMRLVIQQPMGASGPIEQGKYHVKAYSDKDCRYCQEDHRRLGVGNNLIDVEWTEDPIPDWIRKKLPRGSTFPVYVWQVDETRYQWFENSRGMTLDRLYQACKANSLPDHSSLAATGPAGIIHASDKIQQGFDYTRQYLGEGNPFTLSWTHSEGKLNIFAMKDWHFKDVVGSSGRIQFDAPKSVAIPVTTFGTGYRIVGKNIVMDPEQFTLVGMVDMLEMKPSNSMQGTPAGIIGIDDALLLYNCWCMIRDLISLLHPSADVILPDEISATTILIGDTMTIDFDKPPSICLKWLFTFDLKIKQVVITTKKVTVFFSGSGFIKSREFAIQ